MPDDLAYTSAIDLARQIRRGERSPVDVIEATLSRIETRDDDINAFVHVAADEARQAAEAAERDVESGEALGPLHGVPVAAKDLEKVAGMPATFGSAPYGDNVPDESEPWVERVREAGGIIVGKTNTPEFGHKGTTDNLLFGATSTPFAPGRNAGGSSGGSAAAVSDGLVPIAQGSDGGGSIRIPASWCGGFGIKPTYRRIPRKSRPDGFSHTPFSQLGPHARSVEDAALLLSVMAGPHPSDPMVGPNDGTDYLAATRRGIKDLDVAYSPDLDFFPVDDRVATVCSDAMSAFEAAGANISTIEIDHGLDLHDIESSWVAGFEVGFAELAENAAENDGIEYLGADRDRTTPSFAKLIENGYEYDAVSYKRADLVRTTFFESIQAVLSAYDLLALPTLAVPPVENADETGTTLGPAEINGIELNPMVGWCLTYPFNLTGHPVANVPAGLTDDGLPIGLQIVGPRWDDATVLAASAAFERARPWADTYPPR